MEVLTKIVLWLVMLTMLMCTESRDPGLHRVGGGQYTWAPNLNFTEWSTRQHFYVGDWLYFGFDKHRYNVLEVNKTSYEKCIHKDFIHNVTRGGRDVFNLTEEKAYYFICGRGDYCFKGMKVAVYVESDPPSLSPHLTITASTSAFSPSTPTLFASAFMLMFFS
ncbi:Lamin-like protein [Melia azedarach]|uniref:Lamin-like protein n=1 Tax=Melia azedarach TaxID=155640 RepID=A0ACC1YL81_MELAZ|nr:Lamin-like protein [Melia azedarach]